MVFPSSVSLGCVKPKPKHVVHLEKHVWREVSRTGVSRRAVVVLRFGNILGDRDCVLADDVPQTPPAASGPRYRAKLCLSPRGAGASTLSASHPRDLRGATISRGRAWKKPISYLWGHLTAVNDAMFSVLRLGERVHPELDAVFIAQPDRSVPLQPSTEIAKCWEEVHTELFSRFKTVSPEEWLKGTAVCRLKNSN